MLGKGFDSVGLGSDIINNGTKSDRIPFHSRQVQCELISVSP